MSMFGGHDDNAQDSANGGQDDTLNGVADLVGGTAVPGPGDVGYVHPTQPSDDTSAVTPSEPVAELPAPIEESAPASEPVADTPAPVATSTDTNTDDLLDLKQQALQQLSPLIGHLDQSPEEKFRTTMMLIQASDNQSLLRDAYDAAQAITDEKAKAQALLDVINEINYFTQKHDGQ